MVCLVQYLDVDSQGRCLLQEHYQDTGVVAKTTRNGFS